MKSLLCRKLNYFLLIIVFSAPAFSGNDVFLQEIKNIPREEADSPTPDEHEKRLNELITKFTETPLDIRNYVDGEIFSALQARIDPWNLYRTGLRFFSTNSIFFDYSGNEAAEHNVVSRIKHLLDAGLFSQLIAYANPSKPAFTGSRINLAYALLGNAEFINQLRQLVEYTDAKTKDNDFKFLINKMLAPSTNWFANTLFLSRLSKVGLFGKYFDDDYDRQYTFKKYLENEMFKKHVIQILEKGLEEDPKAILETLSQAGKIKHLLTDYVSVEEASQIFAKLAPQLQNLTIDDELRFNSAKLLRYFFPSGQYGSVCDYEKFGSGLKPYLNYVASLRVNQKMIFQGLCGHDGKTIFTDIKKWFAEQYLKNYPRHFKQQTQFLFTDLPKPSTKATEVPLSSDYLRTVVYNQNGYDAPDLTSHCRDNCQAGPPLVLPRGDYILDGKTFTFAADTPIGYNIHLPTSAIKGVFIDVYGGGNLGSELEEAMAYPGQLDPLHKHLLSRGIVVVTTNLIDKIELGDIDQDAMPEEFHARVQLCIHHLLKALRNSQLMNETLATKFYLYGQSFGGMLSLRHAELFSENGFDGYILHDGGLSYEIGIKNDLKIQGERGNKPEEIAARAWLSPTTEGLDEALKDPKIATIKRPVLLLHNFDDNNVNVLVSLGWLDRAKQSGLSDRVRLVITRKGNAFLNELVKGHLITESKREFADYVEAISSFIIQGGHTPEQLELSKKQADEIRIYALKNTKSSSFDEKFLSTAYRFFQYRRGDKECSVHRSWSIFDENNKLDYDRIYYAMLYAQQLRNSGGLDNELKTINVSLTDEKISRVLDNQIPMMVDFYRSNWDISKSIIKETLDENKATLLKDGYREILRNVIAKPDDPDYQENLVYQFYLSNPDDLTRVIGDMEKNPDVVDKKNAALKMLQDKIGVSTILQCGP